MVMPILLAQINVTLSLFSEVVTSLKFLKVPNRAQLLEAWLALTRV